MFKKINESMKHHRVTGLSTWMCIQIAVRELELGVKVLDDLCKKNSAVVLCYFKFLFAFGISLDIILLDVNDI